MCRQRLGTAVATSAQNVFGTALIVAFRIGSLLDCRTLALLIVGNSYFGREGRTTRNLPCLLSCVQRLVQFDWENFDASFV